MGAICGKCGSEGPWLEGWKCLPCEYGKALEREKWLREALRAENEHLREVVRDLLKEGPAWIGTHNTFADREGKQPDSACPWCQARAALEDTCASTSQ